MTHLPNLDVILDDVGLTLIKSFLCVVCSTQMRYFGVVKPTLIRSLASFDTFFHSGFGNSYCPDLNVEKHIKCSEVRHELELTVVTDIHLKSTDGLSHGGIDGHNYPYPFL